MQAENFNQMELDNMDQDEDDKFIIVDTESSEFKDALKENKGDEKMLNRQIQYINHIKEDDGTKTNQRLTFVIQNQYAIVQIPYSMRDNKVLLKKDLDRNSPYRQLTFQRETANAYQKIWNLNGGI